MLWGLLLLRDDDRNDNHDVMIITVLIETMITIALTRGLGALGVVTIA